ncbi:MAG: phosphatase PAP2 family protein [Bacteroidales bacterium]|nr:phosphatase PAP2 family protein [Bacteroidales bacterium]
MDFLNTINSLDTELLLFVNGLHNSFFDELMYTFSQIFVWIPFYVSVLYLIIISHKKKDAIWVILSLVLCIVIADQVASGIIKEAVQRLRPSRNPALEGMIHIVNGYTGGKYGFVSSHAANSFGFALLSSLVFKQKTYTAFVFIWAAIVSYSRIYLGVHYPFDILGGMVVGVMAALIVYFALKKLQPSSLENSGEIPVVIPNLVLGLSVAGIIIYALIEM